MKVPFEVRRFIAALVFVFHEKKESGDESPHSKVCPRAGLLLLVLCLPACQQRMAEQPSYRADEPSAFFPDGRAARPLVAGTVARGHLRTDPHLFAGTRRPQDPARVA